MWASSISFRRSGVRCGRGPGAGLSPRNMAVFQRGIGTESQGRSPELRVHLGDVKGSTMIGS